MIHTVTLIEGVLMFVQVLTAMGMTYLYAFLVEARLEASQAALENAKLVAKTFNVTLEARDLETEAIIEIAESLRLAVLGEDGDIVACRMDELVGALQSVNNARKGDTKHNHTKPTETA